MTIEGRIVADPDIRFAPSGTAVTKFRIVASDRRKNEQTGEWEDSDTLWLTVTCFKKLAENVVESIQKGDLVTAVGKVKTDEWETAEHEKRSQVVMIADSVAASLQFRTIPHNAGRAERSTGPAAEDPWATSSTGSDEPPF